MRMIEICMKFLKYFLILSAFIFFELKSIKFNRNILQILLISIRFFKLKIRPCTHIRLLQILKYERLKN